MLFNLAIRFPSALYVLEASRTHIRYMRIGCMQSTLWPILMTMLIWNDLMNSQHDNLSRGSPRLMTSDRQILYPHIPLAVTPLVALRLDNMNKAVGVTPDEAKTSSGRRFQTNPGL